jgi:hypothetical protein
MEDNLSNLTLVEESCRARILLLPKPRPTAFKAAPLFTATQP